MREMANIVMALHPQSTLDGSAPVKLVHRMRQVAMIIRIRAALRRLAKVKMV